MCVERQKADLKHAPDGKNCSDSETKYKVDYSCIKCETTLRKGPTRNTTRPAPGAWARSDLAHYAWFKKKQKNLIDWAWPVKVVLWLSFIHQFEYLVLSCQWQEASDCSLVPDHDPYAADFENYACNFLWYGVASNIFAVVIILCIRTIENENGYWSTNTCCGCA
jgi:hypothetical protein